MKQLLNLIFLLGLALALVASAQNNSQDQTYTEDKTSILTSADHRDFTIKLKSNPTTGYSWFLREYNAQYLYPVSHSYQAPDNKLVGAGGYEVWTFKMKDIAFAVPLQTKVQFVYARPWEKGPAAKSITFSVSTLGK